MKLPVHHMTYSTRNRLSATHSSLMFLCLVSTLPIDIAHAQPGTTKIAIIFKQFQFIKVMLQLVVPSFCYQNRIVVIEEARSKQKPQET
jgi:hypothetical protein